MWNNAEFFVSNFFVFIKTSSGYWKGRIEKLKSIKNLTLWWESVNQTQTEQIRFKESKRLWFYYFKLLYPLFSVSRWSIKKYENVRYKKLVIIHKVNQIFYDLQVLQRTFVQFEIVKSRSSTLMIVASSSLRSTRLAHCRQAIKACRER